MPGVYAFMSRQTFSDVTIDILERIAARGDAAGFALLIDDDRRSGTLAGATPLGEVEARFDFAPEPAELVVTILRKPPFLPVTLMWAEFARAIERARTEAAAAMAPLVAGS